MNAPSRAGSPGTEPVIADNPEGHRFEARVGSALARSALDDVRSRGLSVVPLCSFVTSWIERHR